jgi:hypothetical protein
MMSNKNLVFQSWRSQIITNMLSKGLMESLALAEMLSIQLAPLPGWLRPTQDISKRADLGILEFGYFSFFFSTRNLVLFG